MRWARLLLAAAVGWTAGCSNSNGTHTVGSVEVPIGAVRLTTLEDDAGAWSILRTADGCYLLEVSIADRRNVGPQRCRPGSIPVLVEVAPADVVFNDREREVADCHGDCGGIPPDATMPTAMFWGSTDEAVGFVCVSVDGQATVLRPDEDGLLLHPLPPAAQDLHVQDGVLAFMPDGRCIGPDPPQADGGRIRRCRADGAPSFTPVTPTEWRLQVDVPPRLSTDGSGLFVRTDTGYSAEGITLQLLAQGSDFRLLLHPDTTSLLVSSERDDSPDATQVLSLPPPVIDILAGASRCPPTTLLLRLDEELNADLVVPADGC